MISHRNVHLSRSYIQTLVKEKPKQGDNQSWLFPTEINPSEEIRMSPPNIPLSHKYCLSYRQCETENTRNYLSFCIWIGRYKFSCTGDNSTVNQETGPEESKQR